jgi:uncharacterized protein YggT (Ycf19 family)
MENFFLYLTKPVFLNFCKDCLLIYLHGFNLFFTLRFVLAWFPNINPFVQPYYIVRVITQPYIGFVAKRIPRLFGVDISFLACSLILSQVMDSLSRLKF